MGFQNRFHLLRTWNILWTDKKMLRMKFFVCLWYYIFILRPINFLSHLVHVIVTHVHIPIPQIN